MTNIAHEIRTKLAQLDLQAAALGRQREQRALAAVRGDKRASAELRDIDDRESKLNAERKTLQAALVPALAEVAAEERAARAAAEAERARQHAEYDRSIIAEAREFDRIAREMVGSLMRIREDFRRQQQLGFQEGAVPRDSAVNNPFALQRALNAVGLHHYLPFLAGSDAGASLEEQYAASFATPASVLAALKADPETGSDPDAA